MKKLFKYSEKPNKIKARLWIENYKRKGCQLCGFKKHPLILEFHHPEGRDRRKGGKKETSSMIGRNLSIKKMQEEIKELMLLCPNCHAWVHYKDIREVRARE